MLADLDLGQDVAEHDELLQHHFVETGSFQDVVSDRADLILGQKGSGKTAIFRRMTDANIDIIELAGTDVLAAFNVRGNPIFQRLASVSPRPDEFQLRLIWWAYVGALVGNHILDSSQRSPEIARLERQLEKAQLRAQGARPGAVWSSLFAKARRILHPNSVEATVSLTGITGRLDFQSDARREAALPTLDLEALVLLEHEILARQGRRVWLAFDRLDESFVEDREMERIALRALLRTHLELASYKLRLGLKLFLRTDVLSQITKNAGFTNATHIRQLQISWEREDIRAMIARRVCASREFREAFDLAGDASERDVMARFLPQVVQRRNAFDWVIQQTSDGTRAPNPRNVVSLMRRARERQMAVDTRESRRVSRKGSLLTDQTLIRAQQDVSTTRLEDTLFAEANELRGWIERFSHQNVAVFNRQALATVLQVPLAGAELSRLIADLVDSGFLARAAANRFEVAPLYRAALSIASPEAAITKKQRKEKTKALPKADRDRPSGARPPGLAGAEAQRRDLSERLIAEDEESERRQVALRSQIERLDKQLPVLRTELRRHAELGQRAAEHASRAIASVEALRTSLESSTRPAQAAAAGSALADAILDQRKRAAAAGKADSVVRQSQRRLRAAQEELAALRAVVQLGE